MDTALTDCSPTLWGVKLSDDIRSTSSAATRHTEARAPTRVQRALPSATRRAPSEHSDEILIRAFVTEGDRESFTVLVDRYATRIRGILYTLLNGSVEDIYDVEQEVVIHLFRSLWRFAFRARFSTYLYRVCTNAASHYLRKAQRGRRAIDRLRKLTDRESEIGEDVHRQLEHKEDIAALYRALTRLSNQDKTIIQLRLFDECSVRECATVLGIREGSVKSRLNRAKQRLTILLTHQRGGYK